MSGTRILGLAQLTVRDAIRSRLFLSLAVLLVLCGVGLPLTVQGDGTVLGRSQVALRYAFGAAAILLSIATLWAACGLLASEISDRRIHLVLAKPVSLLELWIGKWLGIMAVNAVLLALAVALIAGSLLWIFRPAAIRPEDRRTVADRVFATYARLRPDEADVERRTAERLTRLEADGRVPPGVPLPRVRQAVRGSVLREAGTAAPGASVRWQFPPARPLAPRKPAFLVFTCASSLPFGSSAPGVWRIRQTGQSDNLEAGYEATPGIPNVIELPAAALAGNRGVTVEFANCATNPPATVVFEPDRVELRVWCGALWPNLARAALVILCRLGFLAALGIAAGSLLSLPVAVFTACATLVVLALGPYVQTVVTTGVFYVPHEGPPPEPGRLDAALKAIFRGVDLVVGPLLRLDPVSLVADNLLVSWRLVGQAALVLVALYAGALTAGGLWLLRRREIARPG